MVPSDFVGPEPLDIPRRGNSVIRLGLRRFAGKDRLDIRVWVDGGEKPTRLGVSIATDAIPQIIEMLQGMLPAKAVVIETCDKHDGRDGCSA